MSTTIASDHFQAPEDNAATNDPFHDPTLIGIGIAFVILALMIVAFTGLFVWGSIYHAPSWGANSFPPPIVH